MVGFVLLLTFGTMAVIFRSLAVALSAVLLNLLSAAASFGVLVAVFQHTWAEGLLDFDSSGTVVSWLPLFLFVVLFGLSMDYHVFVVSGSGRWRWRARPCGTRCVRASFARRGVVTSAAIVMVAVFSIFGTLNAVEFKQLGVGLAAAIMLDAVVIRIFVLPALMTALGRWNWWPAARPGPVGRRPPYRPRPRAGPVRRRACPPRTHSPPCPGRTRHRRPATRGGSGRATPVTRGEGRPVPRPGASPSFSFLCHSPCHGGQRAAAPVRNSTITLFTVAGSSR
ncbi:hypothetical protein GCM10017744_009310 [Streptomyces antimycoticus]